MNSEDALRITGPDDDGLYWLHAAAPSGISAGWVLAGEGTPIGRRVLAELSTILAPEPIFDAMGLPSVPPIPSLRKE